jgi:hypothetical protein
MLQNAPISLEVCLTVPSPCAEAADHPSLSLRPLDQVPVQSSPPPPHFIENPCTALGVSANLSTFHEDELDPNATPFTPLHLENPMLLSPCAPSFIFAQPLVVLVLQLQDDGIATNDDAPPFLDSFEDFSTLQQLTDLPEQPSDVSPSSTCIFDVSLLPFMQT